MSISQILLKHGLNALQQPLLDKCDELLVDTKTYDREFASVFEIDSCTCIEEKIVGSKKECDINECIQSKKVKVNMDYLVLHTHTEDSGFSNGDINALLVSIPIKTIIAVTPSRSFFILTKTSSDITLQEVTTAITKFDSDCTTCLLSLYSTGNISVSGVNACLESGLNSLINNLSINLIYDKLPSYK